jgi:hypothetical protein
VVLVVLGARNTQQPAHLLHRPLLLLLLLSLLLTVVLRAEAVWQGRHVLLLMALAAGQLAVPVHGCGCC